MKEKTTQAILNAYIKLYGQLKDHRVSMSQIAKECGISRSTLYAYFDGIPEIEEEITLNFYKIIQETFPFMFDRSWHGEDVTQSLASYLAFCKDNLTVTQISLGRKWIPDETFPISKKVLMREAARTIPKANLSTYEDACDLYIYGAYAYFLNWLENGCQEPVEQISQKYMNALHSFVGH